MADAAADQAKTGDKVKIKAVPTKNFGVAKPKPFGSNIMEVSAETKVADYLHRLHPGLGGSYREKAGSSEDILSKYRRKWNTDDGETGLDADGRPHSRMRGKTGLTPPIDVDSEKYTEQLNRELAKICSKMPESRSPYLGDGTVPERYSSLPRKSSPTEPFTKTYNPIDGRFTVYNSLGQEVDPITSRSQSQLYKSEPNLAHANLDGIRSNSPYLTKSREDLPDKFSRSRSPPRPYSPLGPSGRSASLDRLMATFLDPETIARLNEDRPVSALADRKDTRSRSPYVSHRDNPAIDIDSMPKSAFYDPSIAPVDKPTRLTSDYAKSPIVFDRSGTLGRQPASSSLDRSKSPTFSRNAYTNPRDYSSTKMPPTSSYSSADATYGGLTSASYPSTAPLILPPAANYSTASSNYIMTSTHYTTPDVTLSLPVGGSISANQDFYGKSSGNPCEHLTSENDLLRQKVSEQEKELARLKNQLVVARPVPSASVSYTPRPIPSTFESYTPRPIPSTFESFTPTPVPSTFESYYTPRNSGQTVPYLSVQSPISVDVTKSYQSRRTAVTPYLDVAMPTDFSSTPRTQSAAAQRAVKFLDDTDLFPVQGPRSSLEMKNAKVLENAERVLRDLDNEIKDGNRRTPSRSLMTPRSQVPRDDIWMPSPSPRQPPVTPSYFPSDRNNWSRTVVGSKPPSLFENGPRLDQEKSESNDFQVPSRDYYSSEEPMTRRVTSALLKPRYTSEQPIQDQIISKFKDPTTVSMTVGYDQDHRLKVDNVRAALQGDLRKTDKAHNVIKDIQGRQLQTPRGQTGLFQEPPFIATGLSKTTGLARPIPVSPRRDRYSAGCQVYALDDEAQGKGRSPIASPSTMVDEGAFFPTNTMRSSGYNNYTQQSKIAPTPSYLDFQTPTNDWSTSNDFLSPGGFESERCWQPEITLAQQNNSLEQFKKRTKELIDRQQHISKTIANKFRRLDLSVPGSEVPNDDDYYFGGVSPSPSNFKSLNRPGNKQPTLPWKSASLPRGFAASKKFGGSTGDLDTVPKWKRAAEKPNWMRSGESSGFQGRPLSPLVMEYEQNGYY